MVGVVRVRGKHRPGRIASGQERWTSERLERIAADLEALSAVPGRFGGSEGERAVLHAVRERLPEGADPRIEGFVAQSAPHVSLGVHAVLLLAAGIVGFAWPAFAVPITVLVTASLFGEGTGRVSLIRWALPKVASYNLVVRARAARPLGSVVLVAPLDVRRWRPIDRRWTRFRPLRLVLASAVALGVIQALRALAEPWGPYTGTVYGLGLAVLAATVVVGAVTHRAGDGRDDGGSPAVLLELVRRLGEGPVADVDVWFAFVGCGRVPVGGMDAFLSLHRKTLVDPCLVVCLDDAGRPPLQAVVSEGALLRQHHRPTGPALVERLRWAGVDLASVDRAYATDARTATIRGYRSIAFAGGGAAASAAAVARTADVIETLVRWFGHDLHRVAGDRSMLEAIARPPLPEPVSAPIGAEDAASVPGAAQEADVAGRGP